MQTSNPLCVSPLSSIVFDTWCCWSLVSEMEGRGNPYNFFVGFVFALASGIVVGNGAASGDTHSTVSVGMNS